MPRRLRPSGLFIHSFLVLSSSFFIVNSLGCASAPASRAPVFTTEQKLAEIVRLEDQRILRATPPPAPAAPAGRRQRNVVPPHVPDLVPLLSDADAAIRRRAALAVGRVGLADGIPALLPLLKDVDPDVRQMAAFALGIIGDPAASPSLQAALSDTSLVVRGRAAEALGLIGDGNAAAAIADMAREAAAQGDLAAIEPDAETWPMSPSLEAFRLGVYALVRLKAYDPLASVVLAADGRPVSRWWPLAFALSRIEDARAVPALTTLAAGPGRYTRAFAARGLGNAKATAALDTLLPLIDPGTLDPMVAVSVVRAAGQIGGDAAAGSLLALITAPKLDPNVRLEAVAAVGAVMSSGSGGAARIAQAADALMNLAADPWPAMRAQALRSLAQVDRDQFLFALSGLDPDPVWSVRAALAGAMASLPAEIARPRLRSMLADSDRRVIPAVLTSLARSKAPDADAVLRKHLDDPDVVIRMTAAGELGELKPADGAVIFSEAYRQWSGDGTYLARAAALTALARYGAQATETLEAALADREWAVRLKAADLLREADPSSTADTARAIRPVPAQPLVPYDAPEVVAPQFSPHLYLETSKGLIEIELAVREAPLAAQTIIVLARKDFFTNVPFHRVVPNFVVQGGDPRGDGEGGPNFTLRDELSEVPYLRGTVGLALDWRDTGGSQFFITHSPQPHLDARYTVVGRVVKGMEVVDRLQQWDVIERVRVWDGVNLTGGQ
jgi:cyclophilin family peptidyl-prolyl cis-trans isomerase/HEAT repeat protein